MSHFYGTLKGCCGSKGSGIRTVAASWNGAVTVKVYRNEETGQDCFRVSQIPWGSAGISESIASGVIGETTKKTENVNAELLALLKCAAFYVEKHEEWDEGELAEAIRAAIQKAER